jgi:hypothetical protein
MLGRLQDVLDGDQPLQRIASSTTSTRSSRCLCISAFAVSRSSPSRTGDQPVAARHHLADRLVEIGLEAQVAIGDDADDALAVARLDRPAVPRSGARASASSLRAPTCRAAP